MNPLIEAIFYIVVIFIIALILGGSIAMIIYFIKNFITKLKIPKNINNQIEEAKLIKKEVENARQKRREKRISNIREIAERERTPQSEIKRDNFKEPVEQRRRVQIPRPNLENTDNREPQQVKRDVRWDWKGSK